jgi:hypothetical protein
LAKVAPEIDGVDLDREPMRLTEFRDKVVVLYFCELRVMKLRAAITVSVREVSRRHASEPSVFLGVATSSPAAGAGLANPDREAFKNAVAAAG